MQKRRDTEMSKKPLGPAEVLGAITGMEVNADLEVEFRCTRQLPYLSEGCPGFADRSCRQGHYLHAKDANEAHARMAEAFPLDVEDSETLSPSHPFFRRPFTIFRWDGMKEVAP